MLEKKFYIVLTEGGDIVSMHTLQVDAKKSLLKNPRAYEIRYGSVSSLFRLIKKEEKVQ